MSHDSIKHDSIKHDQPVPEDALPDSLRWSLRGLRQDVVPHNDLWSGIATRIEETAVATRPASDRYRRRGWNGVAPLSIAASLVLAIGIAWQLRPLPVETGMTPASSLAQEAAAMTREYDGAMRELAGSNRIELPALRELDRSASAIRTAMTRDPDARFLLDRLRHTYERRLALTQRVALI